MRPLKIDNRPLIIFKGLFIFHEVWFILSYGLTYFGVVIILSGGVPGQLGSWTFV